MGIAARFKPRSAFFGVPQESSGDLYLNFYEPGSSAVHTDCYFSPNGSCTIKPPVGGTWKAALDPPDASTGRLTLTMADHASPSARVSRRRLQGSGAPAAESNSCRADGPGE